MGLVPLPPPWPKGTEPTDEQRELYRAYLVGNLNRTRLGRRSLRRMPEIATSPRRSGGQPKEARET